MGSQRPSCSTSAASGSNSSMFIGATLDLGVQ